MKDKRDRLTLDWMGEPPRPAVLPSDWQQDEYLAGLVAVGAQADGLHVMLACQSEVVLAHAMNGEGSRKALVKLILSRIHADVERDMRPVLTERLRQAGW